ncbi:MAG TPA: SpoIIE family protein phosphatase [Candidatus Baltobacteraceae bacterium]|nr:SpoIIE family protein phosphatase [Candidatus Baltobacteraceae bacterium]
MSNTAKIAETAASLKSVLGTEKLIARPLRPRDDSAENRALRAIAQQMADSPLTALQKIAETAQQICQAGSAGISLFSKKNGDFFSAAIAGAWKPYIGERIPRRFALSGVVFDRNAAQLFVHPERRFSYVAALAPHVEEALVIPFYVAGKAVGTLWVIAHDTVRKFDAEDEHVLESLSTLAAAVYPLGAALEVQEEESKSLRDINEQLVLSTVRMAETLQDRFLPRTLPHTDKVRFDASYTAAEEDMLVGGDWFEATQLPDGRYLISVGDVTGHGLDASVIADRLRQAIINFGFTDENPAAILAHANRILRFQSPGVYATAVVGLIDRDCKGLTYATAGHPPPLFATSQVAQAQALRYGGLPLGADDDLGLASHFIDIPPGAVLAFYTDGLIEFARNIDVAENALKSAVAQVAGDTSVATPAAAIKKKVLGEARATDDIALLIAQFAKIDVVTARHDPAAFAETWRFHSSDVHMAYAIRHELVKFMRRFAADPNALFTAELILGEILANVVEHAPGPVEVQIDWTGEKPVLRVADAGPGLRNRLFELPQDVLAESGRGLFLINALSEAVSLSLSKEGGTELCAVLPLTRRSGLEAIAIDVLVANHPTSSVADASGRSHDRPRP